MLRELVEIFYERNDFELRRGKFRVRGDTLEVMPAYADLAYRVEFFGDEVDRITEIDPLTGEVLRKLDEIEIFPAKHFITPQEKLTEAIKLIEEELEEQLKKFKDEGKLLEAQRLEQRTRYDLEMLREVGLLLGHRELQPAARAAARRLAAVDPAGLLPDGLAADHRRVAHDHPAGARHVQRRPGAQGGAGRLRLPPAERAGQPAAASSRSSRRR